MTGKIRKINKKVLFLAAVIAGILISLLSVKTMAYTDSAGFCRSCHVMDSEYTSFVNSTHANLSCNDCHLPHNSLTGHLLFKGRAGMTHVYFNTFGTKEIPKVIHATDRTLKVVNENCKSCHKSTIKNVSHNAKDDCISCHRAVPHGRGFKDQSYTEQPKSGELLKNKGGY